MGSAPVATISRFSISATRRPLPPVPVTAGIAMAQLPTAHAVPVPVVPLSPLPPGENIELLSSGRLTAQLPAGARPSAAVQDTSTLWST